jgi:hypothetical protein
MGMCSVYSSRKVIMHKRFGFSGVPKTVENLALLRCFFCFSVFQAGRRNKI